MSSIKKEKMSSIKKELYNQSFDEVLNQSNLPRKIGNIESEKLCRSAMVIYHAAQSTYRGGDEELAFIFYMRYCNIVKALQKKPDFRNRQTELTALLGGNEYVLNASDTAEALKQSLILRFNERDNSRKPLSMKSEPLPAISKQNDSSNKSKSPLPIANESKKNSSQE